MLCEVPLTKEQQTFATAHHTTTGIPKAAHGTALHRTGMKMAVSSGKTSSLK